MKAAIALFSLTLLVQSYALSQSEADSPRSYSTKSIEGQKAPDIDGDLKDPSWDLVEWAGNFIQRQPAEGIAPSHQTQFKILYDESFIYVAVRCYDSAPDSIVKWLSRRDGFEGDWIWVAFDSYHDLQSCYGFLTSASGVKSDEFLSLNGNNSDSNWNPIWLTKTQIDAEGWSAEMKIPLSQLRFSAEPNQVWGLQVMRKVFRKEERSVWQRIPLDAGGFVSEFGELHGLSNIKPQKQMEIQPYILTQVNNYTAEEGNPYRTGQDYKLSGGVDAKVGLSNALTMDLTLNPDFGQVEADPAAIALDGFQIFFQEQRPFFIENKNIFDYGVSPSEAGNTFGNDNLFYSRRIGKDPSGYPNIHNGEHVDRPAKTTILGAAKVSGQTQNGWSIGLLETVTSREYARVNQSGEERREVVEPLTNYAVARLKKDFNDRNTSIGGIITSTYRDLEPGLGFLHRSALSGGLDFKHRWKDQAWYVSGNALLSRVQGSTESITMTQESIAHLFQRVGANHVDVDTTRTSLTGSGGHLKLGKVGSGDFMFETGFAWRSPELELNDIGFMRQADDLRHFTWMGYRWRQPFSIFRNAGVNYNHWLVYDFMGNLNGLSWNLNTQANFKNNWYAGTGVNINPVQYSNSELRGGPRYRYVPDKNGWFWAETDGRKKLQASMNLNYGGAKNDAFQYQYYGFGLGYKPINALSISFYPGYSIEYDQLQYVSARYFDGEDRYIRSRIDRETLEFSLRINYSINPNLSVQYYGQPFITKGTYIDFKYVINPISKVYDEKFVQYDQEQIVYVAATGEYEIDEDRDGIIDYSFSDPNFNFFQFRSNMVLRWEYKPGSELYFVWSQGGTRFSNQGREDVFQDLKRDLSMDGLENIFLIKATFRLSL